MKTELRLSDSLRIVPLGIFSSGQRKELKNCDDDATHYSSLWKLF